MKIEFNPDGSLKLPESMAKFKDEKELKDKLNHFTEVRWIESDFNIKHFLENMSYLGCFKSKRNWYYGYKHNNIYLISTGLREITRFNIILDEEANAVYEIIKNKFPKKLFTMTELMEVTKEYPLKSNRIKFYCENHLEELHFNDFYNILLQSCYTLVITNKLVFDRLGRNVLFGLNIKENQIEKKPDIYSGLIFVKEINEKYMLFKNDKFYFDVRCKNFRGSIAPYLIDEIEYMGKLIIEAGDIKQLDVNDIMEKMEYHQRFHDIYQMVIDKNIRNEREKFDFFTSRVKSALRIIANITNLVEIEKEGRGNIYLRKN